MGKLAIRGHETRGKEVIEILEMLGGKLLLTSTGNEPFSIYYINSNGHILCKHYGCYDADAIQYTLEEFLENFPYKIGDKVIYEDKRREITKMVWEEQTNTVAYKLDDKLYCNVINKLQPYKEETMEEELMPRINFTEYCKDKYIIDLGNYEIKKENGVTYAIRKKLQYPKTYKECCNIVGGIASTRHLKYDTMPAYKFEEDLRDSLEILRKLIICRNAYWKIAGEEMELVKPWKPDYTDKYRKKFSIWVDNDKIVTCGAFITTQMILTFPTTKMRDVFYENFKKEIEECKEFL